MFELPPEAGDTTQPRFEPDERWLQSASPELQKTAIWRWFATRYEEMDGSTPKDADGQFFLGVKEPPVTVEAVLLERFGRLVPAELLGSLVRDVRARAGDAWTVLDLDKLSS